MAPAKTNYIAGRWLSADSCSEFTSCNPARTTEVLGAYSRSGHAEVALAVAAARTAFQAWRKTPAPQRAAVLTRMGRLMEERKEALALQMTREMGKVLVEARGDVQEAIDMAHYMAAFGRMPTGHIAPSERPEVYCAAERVAAGVVGMITPWNFPIAIPSWKMFPALLAGNAIVFKPAEDTPGLAVTFVQMLEEAGLPPGVVNLVTGLGEEAGAALVEAEGVDVISFTGSTEIGRRIAAQCGGMLKRISCELGGKNAIVVLEDADIDLAVKGALWSAFGTAGQRCTAASRLIVQKSILPAFREKLLHQTLALRMGDGADPGVEIGPVINRKQLQRIHEYVELGRHEGARLLAGGKIMQEGPFAEGCFYLPTLLDNAAPGMRIAQEEIFGPVTALMEAHTMEDAVQMANATRYGLSLSLYTQNVSRAFHAVQELHAGLVYINLPTSGAEIQLPFGGIKNTGNGHREAGMAAMDYCTEWKSVYVNYSAGSDLVRAQIDTCPQ